MAQSELEYWEKRARAARLAQEARELDPALEHPANRRDESLGRDPGKEYLVGLASGMRARGVREGLLGENSAAKPAAKVSADPVAVKGQIIQEMIRQGKDTEFIAQAMDKITPFIDTLALAGDNPALQTILVSKIMSGGLGTNPTRELIELMRLQRELQPQQQQADPASLMTATTSAIRTGVELSRNNNADPITIAKILADTQAQNHSQTLQMYERLLETSQPRSLREQLGDLRDVQDVLGKIGGKEDKEVRLKMLEIDDKRQEREYTRQAEQAKDARFSKMIEGGIGALSKIAELPVLREAGRKLAENLQNVPAVGKVAGAVGAVGSAQSTAARSLLNEPLNEKFSFTCQKCGQLSNFSRRELTMIESSSTRAWVCPHCGEQYRLSPGSGSTDTGTGPSPPPPYEGPGF